MIAASTYTTYALTWLAILAAVGMLFVVLQPQIAPGANLPGSKGRLMLALGGIAGVIMVLALLTTLGFIFVAFGFADILFLAAILAGLAMAWTGWTAFQAEGGTFQLGTSSAAAAPQTTPPARGSGCRGARSTAGGAGTRRTARRRLSREPAGDGLQPRRLSAPRRPEP